MSAGQSHLVLGGARSGKSRYTLALALRAGGRIAFLATARPLDPDMAGRIARHRGERPPHWQTVEEPFDVVGVCRRLAGEVDLVLLDCLTLWVSNRMSHGDDDTVVLAATDELVELVTDGAPTLLIVSNEVGEGVHPPTEVGRRFRDLLGLVNQRVAAAAARVTLMVAGIPLHVKGGEPEGVPDVRALEAP